MTFRRRWNLFPVSPASARLTACAVSEDGMPRPRFVLTAPRGVNARAGVTNEPRRLSPDVDMRSVDGRRFTDIFDALSLDHPGADPGGPGEGFRSR